MVALSAIFLQNLLVGNIEFKKYSFITSLFIFSLVAFHIYFEISKASLNQQYAFWKIFTLSILISVLVSSIIYFSVAYFIRRHYLIRLSMIIGLLALFLIGELRLYGKWIKKATFAIDYVNKNLPRQIDKDAILIGPYAQTITLGNELRSEIYYFGAYARNDFLFDIMPATHVAYEIGMGSKSGNELKFEEYYPEIKKQSLLIDSYLIGRYYVNIYNINDATVNTKNHVYHWSNFEKAMKYYAESEPDSALKYFEYAGREDHCARAYLYKGNLYLSRGLYEQARHEYQEGLQEDCYDPKFWYLYSISCQRSGLMAESERARNMALKYEPFPGFINNLKF